MAIALALPSRAWRTPLGAAVLAAACSTPSATVPTQSDAGGANVGAPDATGADAAVDVSAPVPVTFAADAWADNWFAVYLGDQLLKEDSVPITTEKSFNKESFTFTGSYPLTLAFVLKDFKQDDSGLEYIGKPNQQIGDGGFVFQLREQASGKLVAVSNAGWRCLPIHRAPLNAGCVKDPKPLETCGFESLPEPVGWRHAGFDDSAWPKAVEFTAAEVGPKDGYLQVNWTPTAKFVWSSDLKIDNTVLCRVTVPAP